MNSLIERRREMMLAAMRRTGISTIVPNALVSGYTFDSISNASRAYTDVLSTTYANLTSATANKECESFWTFETLNIPSGATITGVSCTVKAYGTFGTRYEGLYVDDTAKGVSKSIGSSTDTTRILNPGALTLSDISNVKLRIWGTHANSTSSQYIRLYGATFSVLWDTDPVYYDFYDQEVEDTLADVIGNGVGTTWEVMQFTTELPPNVFKDNTSIVSFDELQYFGSLKTISSSAFNGCTRLESVTIPSTVTSIGNYAFNNCTSIKDLYIPCNVSTQIFRGGTTTATYTVGSYNGDLIIKGNLNAGSQYATVLRFNNIIIHGTASHDTGEGFRGTSVFRVKGNYSIYGTKGGIQNARPFVEFMSNIVYIQQTTAKLFDTATKDIVHFGRTSLVTVSVSSCRELSNINKLYVGDGSSRSNDEDVLDLYLADTNWATYSAKLATWYDYNGTYKWYYVTDVLTNCTNTNPDEWPHITRKDSYHTQIVADDGYTLSSVQVQMYEAVDDGTTPNTPTDITSTAYNASTGEIDIASVTGNVVITATATANS